MTVVVVSQQQRRRKWNRYHNNEKNNNKGVLSIALTLLVFFVLFVANSLFFAPTTTLVTQKGEVGDLFLVTTTTTTATTTTTTALSNNDKNNDDDYARQNKEKRNDVQRMIEEETTSNDNNKKKKDGFPSLSIQQLQRYQQPLIGSGGTNNNNNNNNNNIPKSFFQRKKRRKKNEPIPITETATKFYQHHQQSIQSLINDTTIMDWNRHRRKRGKYRRWLDSFNYYEITDGPATNLSEAIGYDFIYYKDDICLVSQLFKEYRQQQQQQQTQEAPSSLPHVLLIRYNQDFGAFSNDLGGPMNLKIRNVFKLWKNQGCSIEDIMEYVNHPDTLAIFTNQYHVVNHPKIISIPLGLAGTLPDVLLQHIDMIGTTGTGTTTQQSTQAEFEGQATEAADEQQQQPYQRNQLFMLNTNVNQKRTRSRDVSILQRNFRYEIQNTYPIYTGATAAAAAAAEPKESEGGGAANKKEKTKKPSFSTVSARTLYYEEMLQSQFVWSPPGLGLDCYRHWESLYLGAIPVLRHDNRSHTDGWLANIFEDLPVAWIDSYDNLTPEHLQKEYHRIITNWESYNYDKLTRQYWIDLAYSYVNENKNKNNNNNKEEEKQ